MKAISVGIKKMRGRPRLHPLKTQGQRRKAPEGSVFECLKFPVDPDDERRLMSAIFLNCLLNKLKGVGHQQLAELFGVETYTIDGWIRGNMAIPNNLMTYIFALDEAANKSDKIRINLGEIIILRGPLEAMREVLNALH